MATAPICVQLETQYSLTDDPTKLGAREGFRSNCPQPEDFSAGAGFFLQL